MFLYKISKEQLLINPFVLYKVTTAFIEVYFIVYVAVEVIINNNLRVLDTEFC